MAKRRQTDKQTGRQTDTPNKKQSKKEDTMQGMELLTTSEESHREGGWRDRQRQVAKGFTVTVTARHGGTVQHEGSRGRTAQSQRPA